MRKAEFKIAAENFESPKYWSKGEPVRQFRIYTAFQYRWDENDNPEIQDYEAFFTESEALEYAESIELNVGFESIVEPIIFDYEDLNEAFDFREKFELNDLNYKLIRSWQGEDKTVVNEYSGEDIVGAIIIEWSYETYVGYARNLKNIGIAGDWPFYDFKTEADLITGNEERTFYSNYSVLLTAKEIEGVSGDELKDMIYDELNNGHWKWNWFKNNPNSEYISERLKEIC